MKIIIVMVMLFSVLITGCKTTGEQIRLNYNLNENDEKTYTKKVPNEGVYTTVGMGESIISSYRMKEKKGIEVLETVVSKGKFRGKDTEYIVRQALLPVISRDYSGVFYGKSKAVIVRQPSASVNQLMHGGIYIPYEKEKNHAVFFGMPVLTLEQLKSKVKYKEATIVTRSEVGFKRELIYTGSVGSVITLTYKEFKDGMIRSAFTQTLTYDVSSEKVIGFKGALFEVKEATNASITFKVINHL